MTYLYGLKISLMYYDKIRHRPSQILTATGLTLVELEALLITFQYPWDEYYTHFTLKGKVRERISYNRKTNVLPLIQDKMFFILVYLKTHPLQKLHAIEFEMIQPHANKWIHLLSEIFRRTLNTLGELPERNSKRLIHSLKGCEDILLDGTERSIQPPMDEHRQSSCYSGKKLIA